MLRKHIINTFVLFIHSLQWSVKCAAFTETSVEVHTTITVVMMMMVYFSIYLKIGSHTDINCTIPPSRDTFSYLLFRLPNLNLIHKTLSKIVNQIILLHNYANDEQRALQETVGRVGQPWLHLC